MTHRPLSAVLLGALLVLAAAGAASAHVTVNPGEAARGGFTKLAFRVPTESEAASTVKLAVQFPDARTAPLAFASVQPHAGWSYEVERVHLDTPVSSDDGEITDVVQAITWTADSPAAAIKPGEFDEFAVSVGPLPTSGRSLTFKAVQTYSDGSVVRWIETGKDAEHPAPTLSLVAASTGDTGDTGDDDSNALSVIALAVGGLGLLVALASLARRSRR
jgi:uncharacterized protein